MFFPSVTIHGDGLHKPLLLSELTYSSSGQALIMIRFHFAHQYSFFRCLTRMDAHSE